MVRALATGLVALLFAAPGYTAQPAPESSTSPRAEPMRLATPGGTLHGTLLLPMTGDRFPLVLVIAGSGPTDRDGNSAALPGANNSLKLLAEGLASRGIASLRHDKRAIGESAGAATSEADLRFETYVDDVLAWSQQLRKDPRFSTVTILGHSEGSLIGILATQRRASDALVSVAGPARSAGQLLRTQLQPQLPPALWTESERILALLESGQTAASTPPALNALYRPSVQPYLISWLRYTPSRELARLTVPVLIVQGTTDIQVGVAEAEALKQAAPRATLAMIEGMNHVLKLVPPDAAQQAASYSDPSLPVAPQLIEQVSRFVHAVQPAPTQ